MDPYHDPLQNPGMPTDFSRSRSPMRKIIFSIVLVAVIVAAVVFGYFKVVSHSSSPRVSGLPAGYNITTADKGSYPKGFPVNLILYSATTPTLAEMVTQTGAPAQMIVTFTVGSSPYVVFSHYLKTLPGFGWKGQTEQMNGSVMYAVFTKTATTTQTVQVIVTPSANNVATTEAKASIVQINYIPNNHS